MRVLAGLHVFLASSAFVLAPACAAAPPAPPAPPPPPPAAPIAVAVVPSAPAVARVEEPPPVPDAVRELQRAILGGQGAASVVESLTTEVGPRLAGSPGDRLAVAWALRAMRERGLANVRAEPVKVPVWERGVETASNPRRGAASPRRLHTRMERGHPAPGNRGRRGPVRLDGCAHVGGSEGRGGQDRLP